MMYGFGRQRFQMLEAELTRFVDEMPRLGMTGMFVIGPFAQRNVRPGTLLDLVVIQETDEPAHRRADFWVTHLRPRVGVNFYVYTTDDFEKLLSLDPILQAAASNGEKVYG